MQPEEWNRAVELFHAVREMGVGERTLLLNSVCGENHSLRTVVEQMLRNDQSSSTFLVRPAAEQFAAVVIRRNIEAAPSARFGHYEMIGPVGRGGMGEVWEARDTELARNVALKFLAPGTPYGGEEHLTREARMASALNHPNIVTIYEVLRCEDTPIIAMELVEGESLRMLCGTSQPAERVAQLGQQTARALAAAHKAGLIHRDIKPENILVRHDGYVKVVDFGMAGSVANQSVWNRQLAGGTPRYMSPEQSRGECISPATDVFSLGLVLYELATARHAFPGASPFETVQAIQTGLPQPFPSSPPIPKRLQELLVTMLAKNPGRRPPAVDVAKELEQIALSLSVTSKTSGGRRSVISGVLVMLVLAAVWLWTAGRARTNVQNLKVYPLTSQPGWERRPAVSPDGKSIAYTWTERLDGPSKIYVQRLDQKDSVKLAGPQPDEVGYLAWSPDGRRIAFTRGNSIYSIDSSGNREQKILDLRQGNLSSGLDWSPDGNYLAFTDKLPDGYLRAAYTYNLRTGERRKLTSPPAGIWGDWSPTFSPDGRTVAFKRVAGFWADEIYLVPATGGEARKLTNILRGIWGFAWSRDGKSLIVSCQRGSTIFGIWRFFLKNPDNPELIQQGGGDAVMPASSRKTGLAAWVNQLWDLNIYQVDSDGTGTPVRVIGSTLRDQNPVYSADGRIAWISDRSGSREVWIARNDGSAQVQVTNFNGPQINHLEWSSDGRTLAFDSRPDRREAVFLLECELGALTCGKPKQLATAGEAEAPGWSVDNRFIYFASRRTGRHEIWKMPVAGGKPMVVTSNGGYLSRESPDGKWLYFARPVGDGIWRIPSPVYGKPSTSPEELVVGAPYKVQAEGWAVSGDQIIFIDRPTSVRQAAIRSYRFATRKTHMIRPLTELFPDRGDIGVSISRDGRSILYAQLDRSGSNVFVAENIQ